MSDDKIRFLPNHQSHPHTFEHLSWAEMRPAERELFVRRKFHDVVTSPEFGSVLNAIFYVSITLAFVYCCAWCFGKGQESGVQSAVECMLTRDDPELCSDHYK